MDEWLRQTWVHLVALLDHIVRMMYWVWIPGFLLSGFFSLRYHHAALEGLLKAPSGTWRAIAWATVFGMTCSANRRRSLQIATDLAHQGVHPPDMLAFLVSSHSLVLYVLVLLMLLQGGQSWWGSWPSQSLSSSLLGLIILYVIPPPWWGRIQVGGEGEGILQPRGLHLLTGNNWLGNAPIDPPRGARCWARVVAGGRC
ncbi:MAG: hypothetical protein HYZ81_04205 [Nitrospinae bacterium]|nr:hypothetical protein [Nitrospinota bacterium]